MKSIWDTEELANQWSLDFEEMQLLKSKPNRNHLAFVSQPKFYQNLGHFPSSTKDISPTVLYYLASRLEALLAMGSASFLMGSLMFAVAFFPGGTKPHQRVLTTDTAQLTVDLTLPEASLSSRFPGGVVCASHVRAAEVDRARHRV